MNTFPGHIACSSAARSEIVVPLFDAAGEIVGVLDVDSDVPDDFSEVDRFGLEEIARRLRVVFSNACAELTGKSE